MNARKFNKKGLEAFRNYLEIARRDQSLHEMTFLFSEDLSEEITITLPGAKPPQDIVSKADLVKYLNEAEIASSRRFDLKDTFEMSWISAFLLSSIIERKKNGTAKIHDDVHYILNVDRHTRSYRHRIMSSLKIFHEIPRIAHPVWFHRAAYVHGESIEQTLSKLYLMRVPSVAGAIRKLYFLEERRTLRPGVFPKTAKKGDLRNRFPTKLKQLGLTYDTYSCDTDRLIELLGPEFKFD